MSRLDVGGLGGYLRDPAKSAGQSLRLLAGAATSAGPYLEQVERGVRGPGSEVLSHVARGLRHGVDALGAQASALADSAGKPPPAGSVRDAVRADPALT